MEFVEMTNNLRMVERAILIKGSNRLENDVEHSFQLALVAWFLADEHKLSLKQELLIKYALIHDTVEVYAGDVWFYSTTEERKDKVEKERSAAKRLKNEFPNFKEMHKLISDYTNHKDEESKFIYVLDKILPIINIYLDGGRSWRRDKVSLNMLIEAKKDRVLLSLHLKEYFDELVTLLKEKGTDMFPK